MLLSLQLCHIELQGSGVDLNDEIAKEHNDKEIGKRNQFIFKELSAGGDQQGVQGHNQQKAYAVIGVDMGRWIDQPSRQSLFEKLANLMEEGKDKEADET